MSGSEGRERQTGREREKKNNNISICYGEATKQYIYMFDKLDATKTSWTGATISLFYHQNIVPFMVRPVVSGNHEIVIQSIDAVSATAADTNFIDIISSKTGSYEQHCSIATSAAFRAVLGAFSSILLLRTNHNCSHDSARL